jgi:hypothetical protein
MGRRKIPAEDRICTLHVGVPYQDAKAVEHRAFDLGLTIHEFAEAVFRFVLRDLDHDEQVVLLRPHVRYRSSRSLGPEIALGLFGERPQCNKQTARFFRDGDGPVHRVWARRGEAVISFCGQQFHGPQIRWLAHTSLLSRCRAPGCAA